MSSSFPGTMSEKIYVVPNAILLKENFLNRNLIINLDRKEIIVLNRTRIHHMKFNM